MSITVTVDAWETLPKKQPGVYHFRNTNGGSLYIGMTTNTGHRIREHRAKKAWWGEVATIEWHPTANAATAHRLEGELIRHHAPPHNGTRLLPRTDITDPLPDDLREEMERIIGLPFGQDAGRTRAAVRHVVACATLGYSDAAIGDAAGRSASWARDMRAMPNSPYWHRSTLEEWRTA